MPTSSTEPAFEAWRAANPDVVRFLTASDFDAEGSAFLTRMARDVSWRQPLTPPQTAAVRRDLARRTALDEQVAAAPRHGQTAPTGRLVIEGVVIEVTVRPGFNTEAPDHKMALDVNGDHGQYRVLCTVPAALALQPRAPDLGLVGTQVRLTVTLTPRPDNGSVAIGKGPRAATVINPTGLGGPAPARAA